MAAVNELTVPLTTGHDLEANDVPQSTWQKTKRVLSVLGPGLMVCMADSDIGGLFTMADAGADFGYSLLSLQLMLIPALYFAQQLALVLGVCSGRSLVGLVRDELGGVLGAILMCTCVLVGATALISELSGIVVAGELVGLSSQSSCIGAAVLLIAIVVAGDYKKVELFGLFLGAFDIVWLVTVFIIHPPWGEVMQTAVSIPSVESMETSGMGELVMASIGTVVTPWMLFYHMSAVTEKNVKMKDLPLSYLDTAVGCFETQLVMCVVLIVFAATSYGMKLDNMPPHEVFMRPLVPVVGERLAMISVSFAILGCSLLAALVVALSVAWNLADYRGEKSPLEQKVRDAPAFYIGYSATVLLSAWLLCAGQVNLEVLNVGIQVLDGVAMPLVVFVLFYLATKPGVLPEEHRWKGVYAFSAGAVLLICSAVCIYMSLQVVPQWIDEITKVVELQV